MFTQGVDYVNKTVNLMRILDLHDEFNHSQMEISLAGTVMEALKHPYLLKSAKNTARTTACVAESIRHIIISALDESHGLGSIEMNKTLWHFICQDMLQFEQNNELGSECSALDRANAIIGKLQVSKLLDGLSHNLSPLPEAPTYPAGFDDRDVETGAASIGDVTRTAWCTSVEGFDENWQNQYGLALGSLAKAVNAKGVVSIAYVGLPSFLRIISEVEADPR